MQKRDHFPTQQEAGWGLFSRDLGLFAGGCVAITEHRNKPFSKMSV